MVRKTRKVQQKVKATGMTIPELRRAFEHIDHFMDTKVKSLKGKDATTAFRKEWKKVFGKDVSEDAAREYLDFIAANTKTQKGGAAPLSYEMRAGADIPYGSFPKYVSSGFGFANHDSLLSSCGKPNGFPTTTPVGLGSNQVMKGGSKKRQTRKQKQQGGGLGHVLMEAITRPFAAQPVPSVQQDVQMMAKGGAGFPSPRPEINELQYTPKPGLYSISPTTANPRLV